MNYRNIAEAFRRQAEQHGSQIAVRYKKDGGIRDLTWSDYLAEVRACASALVEAGLQPGDRVGLLAENRVEWLIADLGILTAGGVTVSPHSALSARQVHFQLQDSGARWAFVSAPAQADKVRQVRSELPGLQGLVSFDVVPGVESWADFLRRGRQMLPQHAAELAAREASLARNDLATIMYTSGTTGTPKGVMLSHGNILSNVAQCIEAEPIQPDDVALCWLPLSHIFARTCDLYQRALGGSPLCLSESGETVIADIPAFQPTHISCVPRFYEKLLAVVGSPDAAATAMKLKLLFGPRIRFLGAGGAPLPRNIEKTLLDAGLPVRPGYGLTESSPVISCNLTTKHKPGTAGVVLPGVEVKIAPDGEILARGPNIMLGYWNDLEATADAIRGGWLYTGDLGTLDAEGFLTITGRKKELVVLSNGKKVVPTQIENLLTADECIDQAVVNGEGRHYLTALLVPKWDGLRKVCDGKLPSGASEEELAKHPAVHEELEKRVNARLANVAGYEHVRKFHVLPQPFTVPSGEMTVSLKLRRGVILDHHRAELDALYHE